MPGNYEDKIFLIEVEKIKPNPFQPRSEFNNERLRDLADSIRQYGVLQPLVVTRNEVEREDGSLYSEYELIAGERRWRASQLAGLKQVPAVIRTGAQSDKEKLEMAIIENLQREDLNPIERAQAFFRLIKEFNLTHAEVAKRIGRSREYVSNTVRILNLPQEMLDALVSGKINEGHTRPLLMLSDRPHEQVTIFKEIIFKRLNVRDTENIARRIAFDKVRKIETLVEPEILELEEQLTEKYGNRVTVEKKEKGGRVMIDWA
ncbi:MAG TPA: ParB/RepB/Spo0J family partition protein, partial [Candidatus Paceibacterota bacterium]|nr:ParB/RepB/Spo0J family partition protein [Candidatus Paceibacterota bacterium]